MKKGEKIEIALPKFDTSTIECTSTRNNMRLDCIRNDLKDYDEDPDKETRLETGECKFCAYIKRGACGGAAMTTKPCNACGKDVIYSSTITGAICEECGKKHGACIQCGGKMD